MSKSKIWTIATAGITLAFLVLAGALVIIVDPFFHYHKPLDGISYHINNQRYQNPGIVEHFDYDSVISGSSMTENFKTSWFKDIMGINAVKVSYSGTLLKNINIIFSKALEKNKNIKKVFLGIDIYALNADDADADVDKNNSPLPTYLYNGGGGDDVNYVLNKDVICNDIKTVILNTRHGEKTTSFDDAYSWEKFYKFGEKIVLDGYTIPKKSENYYEKDFYLSKVQANLDIHIIPIIEANPNTEFNIFFPPYSIISWYSWKQGNVLDAVIANLDYTIARLLQYENVRLFYFQNIEDIVGNLYLYKDYSHYNSDINYYMTQCFATGEHLLTKNNYKLELEKMRVLAENFNYNIFFGDEIPIKNETDIHNYIPLLSNKDYITVISVKNEATAKIDKRTLADLRALGLKESLNGKYGHSYLGVLNGGKVVYEKLDDAPLKYIAEIFDMKFNLASENFDSGNFSSIKINGVEYSRNSRGINIVVYDKELGRVVDSVCFDTNDTLKISR